MIENEMKIPISIDSRGVTAVVDEDVDGTKAVPMVLVTKNADGLFEYASSGGGGGAGADGKSAYEVAVENGFVGSESAWLASLKGSKGDTGNTGAPGKDGGKGDPGPAGFGTKAQYDAIIARLDALEATT